MKDVIAAVVEALPSRWPALVGITGPIAVGKTTVARALSAELGAPVISTDAFLFSNDVLAARDLVLRKGFPESYDLALAARTLSELRSGAPVVVPVYSHDTYDIVPGAEQRVSPSDVIVVEGVIALQDPIRRYLDLAVYIDAPEEVVRDWFIVRFVRFVEEARSNDASFYHSMSALGEDAIRSIATMTWEGINAINVRDHIAPTRRQADLVVTKAPDHSVRSIERG